jgi:hypothetical protein
MQRRTFLKWTGATGALAGLGDFGFLGNLPSVSAADAKLPPRFVQFHSEIEPLVRMLENTPRDRVLEEVAQKIRKGTPYREVLAALFLAGVRNIQPRPVGFKFHAVLVVNSAHIASLSSPDGERWLPIFWAIDQFKSSQAADEREGDWTMGLVEESKVPPSHKAKQAFTEAMNSWDEAGADAAVVGLVRTAGAHEIFELFCRYGARDFREIGHKAIFVANSFRALEAIGWQHAEPILRSVAYALLDRDGEKQNPAKADLPADRPYRKNLERIKEIRPGWLDGKVEPDATKELFHMIRQSSSLDMSQRAVELLNKGVAPQSLFDACWDGAGELLMRAPGILSLHASTFTNAVHYSWQHCRDQETRKLLLLQNIAFMPLYRGSRQDNGPRLDELEPAPLQSTGPEAVAEIFSDVSKDRILASRKILTYLKSHPDPKPLADAARRLIFTKGRDSHDYKFSSAVLEDYHFMAPEWRDRFLAASVFNLKGAGASDNDLVKRIRSALAA